jgi:hypothetical protein
MYLKKLTITRSIAIFLLFVAAACSHETKSPEVAADTFTVADFIPWTNLKTDSAGNESHHMLVNKTLFLDYTDAIEKGFVVPSIRQTADGFFDMEFRIRNTGASPSTFLYKIYYQNESYKFPERDTADTTLVHPLAWENFYGSWEEVERTFAETPVIPADNEFHVITDRFRIVGNPRNEQRYYSGGKNDRWKRNPRVGKYSFMLVVTAPENVQKQTIPAYIANIGQAFNNTFVNPYFYFLYADGSRMKNTVVSLFPYRLNVIATPDPGSGIYLSPNHYNREAHGKFFLENCGQDSSLYKGAQFQQFVHYIDKTTRYSNIPVIADVLKDNYSLTEYNWNKQFYREDELVAVTASTATIPCKTVVSDPAGHTITLINPGTEFGKWEKQNVGVITRHGFVYGKWTVKAKLTELLNENNIWNGLTNAIWLITMNEAEWNYRRDCNNAGYMATYYGGTQDKRVKNVGYSEIDFEILKTVPYCPSYVLPPAYNHGIDDQYNLENWNIPLPEEIASQNDNLQVACTNWDMACWDPPEFNGGCNPLVYGDQVFWAHRWDRTYRAITTKVPASDNEIFGGEYYYFQIDWQPERIIWRIGPSKENLRVVGYVDNSVTSIPNNQMLLIISQEFHNTRWWVGSTYSQDNIPFPENDIFGEVFEVTIE